MGLSKACCREILLGLAPRLFWVIPFTFGYVREQEIIRAHGGLHDFMGWAGPILTDSGGFQVFSLDELRKVTEDGVVFKSPVNGDRVFLDPETSMQIQRDLGSDVVMIFDECTPFPATEADAERSMQLSLRWAKRSKEAHGDNPSALFGIVQGGMYPELRKRSLATLTEMGFDGYALGGLSVGEPKGEMLRVLDNLAGELPAEAPRYLMGVGTPADLLRVFGAVSICSTALCQPAMPEMRTSSPAAASSSSETPDIKQVPSLWMLTATVTPAKTFHGGIWRT